jgi:hypothetical protein
MNLVNASFLGAAQVSRHSHHAYTIIMRRDDMETTPAMRFGPSMPTRASLASIRSAPCPTHKLGRPPISRHLLGGERDTRQKWWQSFVMLDFPMSSLVLESETLWRPGYRHGFDFVWIYCYWGVFYSESGS